MRICMVLEGCYPYVRGGVSSWMHQCMLAMPEHEYVLWVIGAKAEDKGKFKYELPKNVVEVHEVFLDDALRLHATGKTNTKFSETEVEELRKFMLCEDPDWSILFRLYNKKRVGAIHYLMSETFLDILLEICKNRYPHISFAEFFHTVRSMFLPALYLMSCEVPQADVYHSTSTGYGGLLGVLGGWKYSKPYILTEHGIYTREREEEILRSKWIPTTFKQYWINLFNMIARCSYDNSTRVTSLFQRYSNVQVALGCKPEKRKIIENGIHIEQFSKIPLKKPNGYIDICSIGRIHPIKDIKTMIHAFFQLKSRVSNVRLYILGDTDDEEYEEECKTLIKQLQIEDLFLVGNVNVVSYLENIDFTILTSISEGQPLAVLESLAAGRPVIATDVGCCRELLEGSEDDKFGRAGICEPPMHPQAIAVAMELLATRDDIRYEMGEAGKKRVAARYRHERMIEKYNENYEEVVQRWQASVLS